MKVPGGSAARAWDMKSRANSMFGTYPSRAPVHGSFDSRATAVVAFMSARGP